MNLTPLVSIIVPNFNHAPFLKQRLDSVFNQSFQDFEVILMDDCSTDNSLEILKVYAKNKKVSHFVSNESNSGSPFKQWEKGITLAKGEFIWIAESDDFSELNFLEKIILFYKANPKMGIAYCQTLDVDDVGKQILHRIEYTKQFTPNIWENDFVMPGKKFIELYLSVKNTIPNASAVVFKRELLDPTIFKNKLLEMKMCGDWLFWIQLSFKTSVGFIADELNYFRKHDAVSRNHNSTSRRIKRLKEEKIVRLLLKSIGITNKEANVQFYRSWHSLFPKSAIFSKSLYEGKLDNTLLLSHLSFFIHFLKNKKWL